MTEDITRNLFSDDLTERMAEITRISHLARLENVKAAVLLLRELNIGCIAASYSGSGDSGSMDELKVYKDPIEPEDFFYDGSEHEVLNGVLYARLEQAVAPKMKDSYGQDMVSTSCIDCMLNLLDSFAPEGYEINDGGQGVIVLDAVNCEVRCENSANYVETFTSSSSFTLDDADKLEVERIDELARNPLNGMDQYYREGSSTGSNREQQEDDDNNRCPDCGSIMEEVGRVRDQFMMCGKCEDERRAGEAEDAMDALDEATRIACGWSEATPPTDTKADLQEGT